jgi:hypothetical protein
MSGYPKKDHSQSHPQSAPAGDDVMALLQRMQAQLGYLEKKIDMLIAQKPGGFAPAGGGDRPFRKPFSKPFRPWDRNRESSGPSERSERPGGFSKPGYSKPGFSKPGFSKPGFSKNRPDGQRSFDGPKKPFYKRRDR